MRSERYGGERAQLASRRYNIHARCNIQGLNTAFPNGTPGFAKATWTESVDNRAAEGEILFQSGLGIDSKSPVMTGSNWNTAYNDGVRLPFTPGGFFSLDAAITPPGGDPAGRWRSVWEGRIDHVDPAKNPGYITLRCRDRGAYVINTTIQTGKKYGGDLLAEANIRAILADNLSDFAAFPGNLYVPTPSGFAIVDYWQEEMSVMEALSAFAVARGWDIRYRYETDGGPDSSKLVFYDPDRSISTPMTEIGPSEYLAINEFDINDDDLRNIIEVWYGERLLYRIDDALSRAFFSDRFMRIAEQIGARVNTVTEGQTLAESALSDLKDPFATHGVSLPFWPFVQLNDFYSFAPNGVHYDVAQQFAIVQFTHTLDAAGKGRTDMMGRGKPMGAYSAYLEGEPQKAFVSLNAPSGPAPENGIWGQTADLGFPP